MKKFAFRAVYTASDIESAALLARENFRPLMQGMFDITVVPVAEERHGLSPQRLDEADFYREKVSHLEKSLAICQGRMRFFGGVADSWQKTASRHDRLISYLLNKHPELMDEVIDYRKSYEKTEIKGM